MNKAIIYWSEDCINTQIFTRIESKYYAGIGKLHTTMEEAIDFCESYNVPRNLREWCIDSKDCNGDIWKVWCDERLVNEIKRNTANWFNFHNNDFYWDDNGNRFGVDITGNTVILYEM